MQQFNSNVWFSIILNVLACAAVYFYGRYKAKQLKSLAGSTGSYQLRAYIPTIWTSLGILGTFGSIVISLFIFWCFDINDMNSLILNIAPAFTTSIIGITASIGASIDNKKYLANAEEKESKQFNELSSSLSRNGGLNSPELVLIEVAKLISKGNKDILDGFSSNKSILSTNHNNLKTLLSDLNEKTNTAFTDALRTQKEDFESSIDKLSSLFGHALDKQNQTLADKMTSLESMLKGEITNMQNANLGFINTLVTTIKEKLAKESEERNKQLQSFIVNISSDIKGFIEEQKKLYNSIKQNLEDIEFDMRNLFEEDVKRTISQFAEQQHRLSSETITQCNTKLITDANDYLKNHIGAMSVYLSSLDNQTKAIYSSFINTVNGIAQTVENKLIELYDQQTDLIHETIRINKQSVGDALSENAQSIEAILKANKEAIRDASNEIKSDNDNIKTELASAQKRWKEEAVNAERDHLNEIKSIHTDAEKAIQEILAKITSYDSSVQQSVSSINSEITKSVQEYEKKMSEVKTFIVENHKGLQDDLTNQIHEAFQIKELEVACRKLTDGINSTINSLNKYTTEISGSLSSINTALEGSSKKYIDTVANSNDLLTYISETLLVDKHNITSVIAMLGEIDKLKKAANQIEENVKRIQSMQEGIKNNQTNPRKK